MSTDNGFFSHQTGGSGECLVVIPVVAACHSASTNSRSGLESAWMMTLPTERKLGENGEPVSPCESLD